MDMADNNLTEMWHERREEIELYKEEMKLSRFSPKIFAYYLAMYLVPLVMSVFTFLYIRVLSVEQYLMILRTPIIWGGIIVFIVFVLFWWFSQTKKILAFDPTNPESTDDTNHLAMRFTKISMLSAVINAPLSAAILHGSCIMSGIKVDAAPLYAGCTGNVFLSALLFYILYLQNFEKTLFRVPFREEFKSMSLKLRSVLVSGFGSIGSLMVTVMPALVTELKGEPIHTLFPTLTGAAIKLALFSGFSS